MRHHGIDAKALLGGLAKWFEETRKLEKGRGSPGS
jgi:hypothetical protein